MNQRRRSRRNRISHSFPILMSLTVGPFLSAAVILHSLVA